MVRKVDRMVFSALFYTNCTDDVMRGGSGAVKKRDLLIEDKWLRERRGRWWPGDVVNS